MLSCYTAAANIVCNYNVWDVFFENFAITKIGQACKILPGFLLCYQIIACDAIMR